MTKEEIAAERANIRGWTVEGSSGDGWLLYSKVIDGWTYWKRLRVRMAGSSPCPA